MISIIFFPVFLLRKMISTISSDVVVPSFAENRFNHLLH